MNWIKIFQNAIQCPDGTYLRSLSVHDYQSHTCYVNRKENYYFVDGGFSYLRGSWNGNEKPLHCDSSMSYKELYEKMLVDTGNVKKKWKLICELTKKELDKALSKLYSQFPDGGGYIVALTFSLLHFHGIVLQEKKREKVPKTRARL